MVISRVLWLDRKYRLGRIAMHNRLLYGKCFGGQDKWVDIHFLLAFSRLNCCNTWWFNTPFFSTFKMHEISTRAHLFTLMESTRMNITRMEFSRMESTRPHLFTRIASTWVHSYTRIISIWSHVLTSRPIVTDVQSAIIWVFKSTPNSLPLLF